MELIRRLYYILEKPSLVKYGYVLQKLILLNILVNIASFSIPYFFNINATIATILSYTNSVTVVLFIVELLARYMAIGVDKRFSGLMGRLRYTFQFYTLVDIISIVPFFLLSYNLSYLRIVRLIRFVRILKLIRMKKFIKKFISVNAFASSNLATQSIVLISASAFLIYLFSYAYGSFSKSAMVFLDPPEIGELHTDFHILVGVIELIVGLFIGGALISIITSALEQIMDSINSGYFTYKESGHIVIINKNLKLDFIFDEINRYYIGEQEEQNIVLLLAPTQIEKFKKGLKEYSNLNIIAIAGDPLNWNSYERVNLNKASKAIVLLSREKNKNQNKKITKFITDNENFKNEDLSFVIETEHLQYSNEIYNYIFDGLANHYTLVNNNDLIAKILNRSVVNYDYFKIYSELLSFDGNEFYTIDYADMFEQELTFQELSLRVKKAVLTGIIRDEEVMLNPPSSTKLLSSDKLIMIMEDRFAYEINNAYTPAQNSPLVFTKPQLKENRNIVIVGNHTDIDMSSITQFLISKSSDNLKEIVRADGDYMDLGLWNELQNSNVDVIILNLEDEYEFNLSLYLQSIYKNKPDFLVKIVNILHDPTIAMLLNTNKRRNSDSSMILSQKLIGEFISQALFNLYTYDIFDEITQSKGNELYILDKTTYFSLYGMDYATLKATLLNNSMIYIGSFIDGAFVFYSTEVQRAEKIVVLAEGED